MGERVETDAVDEELAAQQVETIKEEADKGFFEDFDESLIITVIGKNTIAQNVLVADLFEKTYGSSLRKALKDKCGKRLYDALNGLCMPKADFLAWHMHEALDDTDRDDIARVLGGLDGEKMVGVAEAYERKYNQPLWSALKEKIKAGDFLRAAMTWVRALHDPSKGAEKFTEVDVEEHGDDVEKLGTMLDYLLLEHDSQLVFVAALDVEILREACVKSGTDDTVMIRTFATRNKRALARVNIGYREAYSEPLQMLIDRELLVEGDEKKNVWYAYLAKFLVVQEEQADAMILEDALGYGQASVNHQAMNEFLCGRHPKRVIAAKKKWEQRNDESLVDKLSDSLSGPFLTIALKLLKGKRDSDDQVDEAQARKLAHQLHDGAQDYVSVLCENSPAMNAAINAAFENAYDMSLNRAISSEFSGPSKQALKALISGPHEWYAAQLRAALDGEVVDDQTVCRIIGAHDKEEIAKIAKAYDKKYGFLLKTAVTNKCAGNYKRLAVAWIDIPDQLAQPEKLVELPIENVSEAAQGGDVGKSYDDEISDEDDVMLSRPDPAGGLFKAKLALWQSKYEKYRDLGKQNKMDHYQRLLIMYPPAPPNHKLLHGYSSAIEEEYKGGAHSTEDWTTLWFETLKDEDFEGGADREAFKKWMDCTESMVAEKRISPKELKAHWGLEEAKPKPKPKYEEPEPVAALPIAEPIAPPVAQPVYAQPYQQPPPVVVAPPPPIYQQQVYYQPPPVVVAPQPVYVAPQPIYQPPVTMYAPQPQIRVNYMY